MGHPDGARLGQHGEARRKVMIQLFNTEGVRAQGSDGFGASSMPLLFVLSPIANGMVHLPGKRKDCSPLLHLGYYFYGSQT